MNAEAALHRQMLAARDLLADIKAQGADDDAELVADAIEGETNLPEAIAAALDEIDEAEILILGAKAKIAQIEGRVAMEEKRVERIRAAIERALVMVDQSEPMRLPTGTISIVRRAAQPIIEDEAAIPSRFFVPVPQPAPKLDKKALAKALRDKEQIPGARLDNGSVILAIRR